jgi:hypothetical protein
MLTAWTRHPLPEPVTPANDRTLTYGNAWTRKKRANTDKQHDICNGVMFVPAFHKRQHAAP